MEVMKNSNDLTLSLNEIKELNNEFSMFQKTMETIGNGEVLFFDTDDIRKITGWSKHTVETLFNNPAFPCTDLGKRKLVLKTAFIKFFMERRCKENEKYWDFIA